MTNSKGVELLFTTIASSSEHYLAYGKYLFYETIKYNFHSTYLASKVSTDHFVFDFHDSYGMPHCVQLSKQLWFYHFSEKLIPLVINNIRYCKPLRVYGRGENVRDLLYVFVMSVLSTLSSIIVLLQRLKILASFPIRVLLAGIIAQLTNRYYSPLVAGIFFFFVLYLIAT